MGIKDATLSFGDVGRVAAGPPRSRVDHFGSNGCIHDEDHSAIIHRFVAGATDGNPSGVPKANLDSPGAVSIGASPSPAEGARFIVGGVRAVVNNVDVVAGGGGVQTDDLVRAILVDFKFGVKSANVIRFRIKAGEVRFAAI
jgi:hypothetical protein